MATPTVLNQVLKQGRLGLWVLIGFGFVSNMLMLATPLYMVQIFDRVLSSGSLETLLFLTLIIIVALLIAGILDAVRKKLQNRIGTWLDKRLSPVLLKASMSGALQGMPASAQSLQDLATIRRFINGPLRVLTDVLWVPIFIVAVSLLHSWLGMFAVFFGILLVAAGWLNELVTKEPVSEASEEQIKNHHLATLAVRNSDVIQAMGMFNSFSQGWQKRNNQVLEKRQIASDRSSNLYGLSRFLRMAAQAGILGLGAYLVLNNQLTAGGMIAGSILLARALGPLEQSISSWVSFLGTRSAYGRIKALLERTEFAATQSNLPGPRGRLAGEQITFIPRGHKKPVLNRVSFSLEPGTVLGILGPSSAGKTTLCKMLVGTLQPNDGHARLDSVDVFAWDSEELGKYVGYLPQDVELFSTTIAENIARLDANPDPVKVQEAAKMANVHDMVLHLENGYDTEIGDGKLHLSGGQRQRIGLARALYGRPKLIVLDEPNSNLDTDGEEALIKAIATARAWGATIVLVTHQMRLLRPVDKVLVLQEGSVKLFGDRDDILSKLRFKQVNIVEEGEETKGPVPSLGSSNQSSGENS